MSSAASTGGQTPPPAPALTNPALSNPGLSNTVLSPSASRRVLPRPEVQAMEGYHSPQVACEVRLNTNESPFSPPSAWQEALADEVAQLDVRRYPDRAARALRADIAEHHHVSPDQVFVANGSNEVLQTMLLTYGGPGRSVLTFEPTYAMHSHIARTIGSRMVVGNRRDDFTIDPAYASDLVATEQPDVVFLCSPNNPTGMIEPRSLVEAMSEQVPGVLLVDEAYGQFAEWSAQELLSEDRALCVSRTYSKTWAMAGVRLGYLLGPSWMITEFDKVVLPYHLDSIKQAAGRLALRYSAEMRARVGELVNQRNVLVSGLSALPVQVWPSEANFILFRPTTMPADALWEALVQRSVLVRNCASWPGLEGCLRVTVGTQEENGAFLDAMRVITGVLQTAQGKF
jgi:histidinol-phosphate aminotransferase